MFRPARVKVWLPAACGVFFLAVALPFAAMPRVVNKSNPALYVAGLVGLFMAGLAAWMFLAARNAARVLVTIGDEGLELSLQPWGLWKFGNSRREHSLGGNSSHQGLPAREFPAARRLGAELHYLQVPR
jgi:hypothetical protein